MGKAYVYNETNLPETKKLQGFHYDPLPYFILGDEFFPLKSWISRPFPGKNVSEEQLVYKRHSRARPTIENAFHCVKYRNFTKFLVRKFLRKGAVSA